MAKKRRKSRKRRASLILGGALVLVLALWAVAGDWFVHHPRRWHERIAASWPSFVVSPLLYLGNPVADFTDAMNWTGHDAVYEYDEEAPAGSVVFAGAPRRTGLPAPDDIKVLERGDFIVGWSPKLHHPAWCAYHVMPKARYEAGKRPNFTRDKGVPSAPGPSDYTRTGYDRGHMVPNYAIVTRYGEAAQKRTFLMSNIAPQTPSLNRGVWRDLEHRIADLWTARYGEIWVVVGCIPDTTGETLAGTDVDVPSKFFQVVVAQVGMDVRAFAVLFDRNERWDAWAARNLITIDELETLTGLDFMPELPEFIQSPLEAELPDRLWPIRPLDIFRQIAIRYAR